MPCFQKEETFKSTADFEEYINQIVSITESLDIFVHTAKFEITFSQYKCVSVYSVAISCLLKNSIALWQAEN